MRIASGGVKRRQDSRTGVRRYGYSGYNNAMALAIFSMRLLESMFFVGLIGSAVVVVISFIEDGAELVGKE